MNKIVNWTIGSFFRTIGRIIAYIGIGYLVALCLSNSDFSIENLFFTRVSAAEYKNSYFLTYYTDANKTNQYATLSGGIISWTALTTQTSATITFNDTNFYFNDTNLSQYKGGYISFPFQVIYPRVSTSTTSTIYGQDECTRYDCGSYNTQYGTCSRYTCVQFSTGQDSTITDREYIAPDTIFVPIMYFNVSGSDYWVTCDIDSTTNTIKCPIKSDMTKVTRLRISSYVRYNSTQYEYKINLGKNVSVYTSGTQDIINAQEQNTQAIQNQTQQQQQQHEEMMDSNTTEAENEATDFFEDFEVPDVGGLSAIITAPLSTIQSLLNSTCTPLVLPLPFVDEDLTLPCLNAIYTEHFGAFFTLYQTIILAIVAYRCIRSIFFDIHGFTDPSDDRIEVMDL